MFVALETYGFGAGHTGGVLSVLTKPKARLEARKTKGAVYGVIVAAGPLRASGWRRVAALAGRYADRMLLPAGLKAPPPIKEPAFPRFERLVILKTAAEIVALTRMPMYRRIAGLIDEDGKYADFLFPLLHHYTTVKVLTNRTGLYEEAAARMMEELGAPVILCGDSSALGDCVLVVAPEGLPFPETPGCPVLAKTPPKIRRNGDFITDLKVEPAPEMIAGCPAGIEPHKFSAALYEYCGVEAACRAAKTVTWRGASASLNDVARDISILSGVKTLDIMSKS